MNASDDIPDPVWASDHIRVVHDAGVMTSGNALESGNERSRVRNIVSEWYALNPDIRQLWVHESGETDPDDASDIYVTVVLMPVCDSDDISPIWLARSTSWQRHLQRLIGRRVHLDWLDGDTEVLPCAEGSEHSRACLVSTAWRDYGDEVRPRRSPCGSVEGTAHGSGE